MSYPRIMLMTALMSWPSILVNAQPVQNFFAWDSTDPAVITVAQPELAKLYTDGTYRQSTHPLRSQNKTFDLGSQRKIRVDDWRNITMKVTDTGKIQASLNLNRELKHYASTTNEFQADEHTQFMVRSDGQEWATDPDYDDQTLLSGVMYKYHFDVTILDTYPAATPSADRWWNRTAYMIVHQLHGRFDTKDFHKGKKNGEPMFEICVTNVNGAPYWLVRNRSGVGDEDAGDYAHETIRLLKAGSGYETLGTDPTIDSRYQPFGAPDESGFSGRRTYRFDVEIRLSDGVNENGRTKVTFTPFDGFEQPGNPVVMLDRDNVENSYRRKPSLSTLAPPGPSAYFGIYTGPSTAIPKPVWNPSQEDSNGDGIADEFQPAPGEEPIYDSDGDGITDVKEIQAVALGIPLDSQPYMDLEAIVPHGPGGAGLKGDGIYFEQICLHFDNIEFGRVLPGDTDGDWDVDFTDFLVLAENFNDGTGKTWADGDFEGDGEVGFGDFLILTANFDSSGQQIAQADVDSLGQ